MVENRGLMAEGGTMKRGFVPYVTMNVGTTY
jgi:hypothetical protein